MVESAAGRWIYVFSINDGTKAEDAWEIEVDENGRFASYELTEQNYDARDTERPEFAKMILLPSVNEDGASIQYRACISEFRIPKQRLFDRQTGIASNLEKRCDDIDDEDQVKWGMSKDGIEMVGLVNYVSQAVREREAFDEAFEEWQAGRLPSSLENDSEKKKEKLLYEFAALLLQVCEAFPDYRKHIADYPGFYDFVKERDQLKKDNDTNMRTRVDRLCRRLSTERFTETCKDFVSLVQPGDDQQEVLYSFEDRLGQLLSELTRFPRGMDTVKSLFPKVSSATDQTWLQDLMLLKNDVWNANGAQGMPDQSSSDPMKTYNNTRKIGDGLIKLMAEAAKSGVDAFTPEQMGSVLKKVLGTTGESVEVGVGLVPAKASTTTKPFLKALLFKEQDNFWVFKIDRETISDNFLMRVAASKGMDKILLSLETVSVLYSLQDIAQKCDRGELKGLEAFNSYMSIVTFVAENVAKIAKGPVMVANFATSAIDCYLCIKAAGKDSEEHDIDAAVFNLIAAGGFAVAAVGSGALAMTFFAGAAASSATGIGIAPGLLLLVVGSIVAVGGKVVAEIADNTAMENLMLKTPWGTHPSAAVANIGLAQLKEQYAVTVRILNAFKVDLEVADLTAIVHLSRLEPESVVALHRVEFGVAQSSRDNRYSKSVVGQDIRLTTENCVVRPASGSGAYELEVDLANLCGTQYDQYWMANRPDYVGITLSVDLNGDGELVLPEPNKKVHVHGYTGAQGVQRIG